MQRRYTLLFQTVWLDAVCCPRMPTSISHPLVVCIALVASQRGRSISHCNVPAESSDIGTCNVKAVCTYALTVDEIWRAGFDVAIARLLRAQQFGVRRAAVSALHTSVDAQGVMLAVFAECSLPVVLAQKLLAVPHPRRAVLELVPLARHTVTQRNYATRFGADEVTTAVEGKLRGDRESG